MKIVSALVMIAGVIGLVCAFIPRMDNALLIFAGGVAAILVGGSVSLLVDIANAIAPRTNWLKPVKDLGYPKKV